jgi:hypothetical protein
MREVEPCTAPPSGAADTDLPELLIIVIRSLGGTFRFEEFLDVGLLVEGEFSWPAAIPGEADFRLRESIAAAAALAAAGFCAPRFGVPTVFPAVAASLAAMRRADSVDAVCFARAGRCLAWVSLAICRDALAETDFKAARSSAAVVTRGAVLMPRATVPFLTLRPLARGTARDAETFFLAADFVVDSERARVAVADGAFDFDLRPIFFVERVLTARARAAAVFFALSSAARLDVFALGVPICLACFAFDNFTVFFTDAITSALLFSFPAVETGRVLAAEVTSADRKICISALREGRNRTLLNDDHPAKIAGFTTQGILSAVPSGNRLARRPESLRDADDALPPTRCFDNRH